MVWKDFYISSLLNSSMYVCMYVCKSTCGMQKWYLIVLYIFLQVRMLNQCIREPYSRMAIFVMQNGRNAILDFIQVFHNKPRVNHVESWNKIFHKLRKIYEIKGKLLKYSNRTYIVLCRQWKIIKFSTCAALFEGGFSVKKFLRESVKFK